MKGFAGPCLNSRPVKPRRPGRPTAPVMDGYRVVELRARLIELMVRTVLSANDISVLLKGVLDDRAPSRTVVESDIAIATGAERQSMDATRWSIYVAFASMLTASHEPTIDTVFLRALSELAAKEKHLHDVAERYARSRVPQANRDMQVNLQIAFYDPGYHRDRMRIYLQAVRRLARDIFAARLREDNGATFLSTIEDKASLRSLMRTHSHSIFEQKADHALNRSLELWSQTRRSSLNLARDYPLGHRAKALTAGEFAVHSRLIGRTLGDFFLPTSVYTST